MHYAKNVHIFQFTGIQSLVFACHLIFIPKRDAFPDLGIFCEFVLFKNQVITRHLQSNSFLNASIQIKIQILIPFIYQYVTMITLFHLLGQKPK